MLYSGFVGKLLGSVRLSNLVDLENARLEPGRRCCRVAQRCPDLARRDALLGALRQQALDRAVVRGPTHPQQQCPELFGFQGPGVVGI